MSKKNFKVGTTFKNKRGNTVEVVRVRADIGPQYPVHVKVVSGRQDIMNYTVTLEGRRFWGGLTDDDLILDEIVTSLELESGQVWVLKNGLEVEITGISLLARATKWYNAQVISTENAVMTHAEAYHGIRLQYDEQGGGPHQVSFDLSHKQDPNTLSLADGQVWKVRNGSLAVIAHVNRSDVTVSSFLLSQFGDLIRSTGYRVNLDGRMLQGSRGETNCDLVQLVGSFSKDY